MSTLILGTNGFLGQKLYLFSKENFPNLKIIGNSQKYYSESTLKGMLYRAKPNLIFNCIAMTNASQCEESPEEANWVNGEIPSILATYCKKEGARLIHLSTDAVMDINKSLKCESDNPKPSDTYGMSKLAGETALMEMQCNYLICRVNFFGLSNKKQSLLDFFVKNIINKRECYGYTNVLFNPISVDNLVKTLWKLEELRIRGLIHITGDDVISKYEFGKEVEAIISGENNFVIPHELSIKEARNIKDLSLCSCKLRNVIQTPFKDWKTELKKQLKGIGDSYEDRN